MGTRITITTVASYIHILYINLVIYCFTIIHSNFIQYIKLSLTSSSSRICLFAFIDLPIIHLVINQTVLIFYQLAIKAQNLGWEIVTLLFFQVAKIALIHYEMYIFRVILGPVSDSFSRILAIR